MAKTPEHCGDGKAHRVGTTGQPSTAMRDGHIDTKASVRRDDSQLDKSRLKKLARPTFPSAEND